MHDSCNSYFMWYSAILTYTDEVMCFPCGKDKGSFKSLFSTLSSRHMLFWNASVCNTAVQHWCNEELWLTWSITQWPSFDAFSIAISAAASCPWPSDTLWSSPESMVNSNLFPKQNNILYYLEPNNEVFKQACVLHTVKMAPHHMSHQRENSPQKYSFNKSAELEYCAAFWLGILY